MVIVGNNLLELVKQKKVCPPNLVEEYSIVVRLGAKIFLPKKSAPPTVIDVGGFQDLAVHFEEQILTNTDGKLKLKPGDSALAASLDSFFIPLGYFGLLQTKGTVGRLFLSIHCSDSQIDPGFKGCITLEIVNNSPFEIHLPVGSPVGQLYIMQCSTKNCQPYAGKYKDSTGPTLPRLGNFS